MSDFLSFRKMITPVIIVALFWAGSLFCVVGGLIGMASGMASSYGASQQVLGSFLLVVLGPIAVRIWCELLILFFRMNETLTDIRNSLAAPKGPSNLNWRANQSSDDL